MQNNIFNKYKFILFHQLFDRKFYQLYRQFIDEQYLSYSALKQKQEIQLNKIVKFAYDNVPFYHNIYEKSELNIHNLKNLPIINKEIIRKNYDDFKPNDLNKQKYIYGSTGGTTGNPLKFRISKEQRLRAGCLLYRGWSYGGYELSDKMVVLAGASLNMGGTSNIKQRINEIIRNMKLFSSFDMDNIHLNHYTEVINHFKPKFIRGYPSAINELAMWIEKNGRKIHSPKAIFTTSEKLFPPTREKIQSIFQSEVFDGYGLYDGGVTAFECEKHEGLHIDIENAILEVVDDNGNRVDEGEGRIIATSLYSYAFPFIRYDTGDIGIVTKEKCSCGRPYPLLKEIVGRSVDVLFTPDGKKIHGWFFLYIFWEYCKGVSQYQVIQEDFENIRIKIIKDKDFDEKQLDLISKTVYKRSPGWKLNFEFVEHIETSHSGKFKFIINNVKEN